MVPVMQPAILAQPTDYWDVQIQAFFTSNNKKIKIKATALTYCDQWDNGDKSQA